MEITEKLNRVAFKPLEEYDAVLIEMSKMKLTEESGYHNDTIYWNIILGSYSYERYTEWDVECPRTNFKQFTGEVCVAKFYHKYLAMIFAENLSKQYKVFLHNLEDIDPFLEEYYNQGEDDLPFSDLMY